FDALTDRHRRISRPRTIPRKPLDTVFLHRVGPRVILRNSWALHGCWCLLLPIRGRLLNGLDHLYGYCCTCWDHGVPCPIRNNATCKSAAATSAVADRSWTTSDPSEPAMGSAQSAGCTAAVWRLSAASTSWFPGLVLATTIVAGNYLPRLFVQTSFQPTIVSDG